MEESDGGLRASVLALHLGALYSCPTELPLSERVGCSGGTSHRCLVPDRSAAELHSSSSSRGSNNQQECRLGNGDPADGSISSASAAQAAFSWPIREVFCRALPVSVSPPADTAAATAALQTATKRNDDDDSCIVDVLLPEALGLMYRGLHAIRSPQRSTCCVVAAGTTAEALDDDNAAQPAPSSSSSTVPPPPRLVASMPLHAGLIPLHTPLVESDDGTFLVRRLHD